MVMSERPTINSAATFITPSDVGQSYVRIAVVSAIIIWTFANEAPRSIGAVFSNPLLLSMPIYFVYCLSFLLLSYRLADGRRMSDIWFHVKRVVGLFGDLISCGLYILLAGEYGLAIYPIYVTIIVGYGLRYGVRYLFLAMGVALSTFTVAAIYSPLFEEHQSLIGGFYLGLILIPGYAAVLLKKYQDLLVHLSEFNAARSRFIANMSHELRTPLHAIIGNAEVLAEKLSNLEKEDRSFARLATSARMVSEASEHLRALVDGVLDIASSDAGTFVLGEPVETDLYQIIQSSVGITKPGGTTRNVEFCVYIDPDVPRVVETWEQLLKAVLINTIGNAVKYTNTGSISVLVHPVESSDVHADPLIRFQITDTGIGISPSQLKTIYEPFMIGDDSRARNYEGTGLGLTITKQYLNEMGGSIDIQSEEGIGTTVNVEIPMRPVESPPVENVRRGLLALVISADSDQIEMRTWLQSHNIEIESRTWDGTNLTTDYKNRQPDVVLISATDSDVLDSITAYIAVNFENALAVLIGASIPPGIKLPGKFVTRIETGNETHLRNLYSLIERALTVQMKTSVTGCTILVVDDNETNLQSAAIALESYGHSVRTANGGHDALRAMQQENFDLVFMDMHMPGLSGVEVARTFAADSATSIPIVMLTADVTKSASVDADIPQIVGFLTKPIKPSELQLAVERYVDADRIEVGSSEIVSRDRLMEIMESRSFSRENYVELHNSGVSQGRLDN